jgi:putative transposase
VKRDNIEPDQTMMPVSHQCELLGLSRSSFTYEPLEENEFNLTLMRRIDEEFTKHPFYGARRMKARLRNQGYGVNRKRVSRLIGLMGLAAIYPKPRLARNGSDHKVYPYLLNGLTINAPHQAWCTDITYIRPAQGFVYFVAIMDWHSRYVPAWALSTTLDKGFCLDAVR